MDEQNLNSTVSEEKEQDKETIMDDRENYISENERNNDVIIMTLEIKKNIPQEKDEIRKDRKQNEEKLDEMKKNIK